jgi:multisubunit Na+/H+ antiporter MnhC subunit
MRRLSDSVGGSPRRGARVGKTFAHHVSGISWLSSSPRSARLVFIAMLLELGVGLVVSAVVLVAFAPSAASLAGLVWMPTGSPTPFISALLLTAIVVATQGGAAIALRQQHVWLRVVGLVVALAIGIVCALFLLAIVIEFATKAARCTLAGSGGDVYDQIAVYASILPALAVLILNGRAAFFAARELAGRT